MFLYNFEERPTLTISLLRDYHKEELKVVTVTALSLNSEKTKQIYPIR